MPNPLDPNPAPASALFGGKHVTVRYRDPALVPESVLVRELPPSEYNGYLANMHNPTQLAEFICARPKGWADSLAFESLMEVHQAITDQHDPTFGPWLERQGPILARLNALGSPSGGSASAAR